MAKQAKSTNADILAPRLVLIITTLALVLFGLVMVFSASSVEAINNNESPFSYLIKQTGFCIIGLVGAILIWRKLPISFWRSKYVWVVAFILFGLMLLTLIMGADILGARRWIYIGGMSLQPSEFAKIILVLLVGKLYFDKIDGYLDTKQFIYRLAPVLMVSGALILLAQSDLGTTIICSIGILSVFWLAGAPKKVLIAALILMCCLGIVFIFGTGYRTNRLVFLDPYNDGADGYGAGYQTIRSRYAFAEGGLFGVGLGNSYEKFQYLPEAETDFIFAVIGEELGLIGSLVVVALFVVFLISGLKVAKNCASGFGASISGAFVIMIVFQAFLNILCVIGFAPTTGKPLPFISSGGSSLIATLLMVGFILAASEELPKFERKRSKIKAVQPKPKIAQPKFRRS
ncbi:MAG: putative peptidoglycan glycosyltransferase FtsW [Coriobacteriia bacterium]|nr:putative peptidoglycan glycosyltransferase FtsW [Coriobacteriia bacterium]